MSDLLEPDIEALRQAALRIAHRWNSTKALMALRATGLDHIGAKRSSLDAIAVELGVSRETVRRARNDLLHAIELEPGATRDTVSSVLALNVPSGPSVTASATARALRRLLTMTGPLQWDEVLSAWSRAGGKPPYSPLPAGTDSMRTWAETVGGFRVSDVGVRPVTIEVVLPEDLDQVGQFLLAALREQSGGICRSELLDLAKEAGLKATTVATALSIHPAVTRVSRGVWALHGRRPGVSRQPVLNAVPRRTARARPTSFTWSADGSLLIEFSIPHGPSPVVAVPKAVSAIVEGREFHVENGEKPTWVTVRNARLWGFGSLLSDRRIPSATRVTIALNLMASKATITPIEGKGPTQ